MLRQLKYLRDSLHIVVILALAGEFFSAKWAQFPLRNRIEYGILFPYGIELSDKKFFFRNCYHSLFRKIFKKKFIQKKNAPRFAHVQFDSISFYLFFAMELKDANGKSHWKNLVFWDQWEMMSDLNVSHGETSKKLRNFESHWDIFKIMFLDKEDMTSDLNISSGKMSDFIHLYCLGVRYALQNNEWFGLSFVIWAQFRQQVEKYEFYTLLK